MSNDEILDSYLKKGGIYPEIYYLLLKLAKPAQGRYRLKMMLDEVFVAASSICNEICKLNHPEANFVALWYDTKNDHTRYETDLIYSVVYTLLRCVPVEGKNFYPVILEIEEKNSRDTTYFPYFKELAEKWLNDQKSKTESISTSQLDPIFSELNNLRKENEELKLRNADLEEKNRDQEFKITEIQSQMNVSPIIETANERIVHDGYTFDKILSYCKSRQSYSNSEQIMVMLTKFLRQEGGTKEQWKQLDEVEDYLLNRQGGITMKIDQNFAPLTTNEKGGYIINMSSASDMEQLKVLLMQNNIQIIDK